MAQNGGLRWASQSRASGCPPLKAHWFHAVDIPKRESPSPEAFIKSRQKNGNPLRRPEKFEAFTVSDSKAIEKAYQIQLEKKFNSSFVPTLKRKFGSSNGPSDREDDLEVRVPVSEDFLFDVNIADRELAPVYWLGPVYEVRRGTWFYQEGQTLRPCEESLATQLEAGYLEVCPWQSDPEVPVTRETSSRIQELPNADSNHAISVQQPEKASTNTYKLQGMFLNTTVTYQDAETAWLSTEGVVSWVTAQLYGRISGKTYQSGIKLVRGYNTPARDNKTPEDKKGDGDRIGIMPKESVAGPQSGMGSGSGFHSFSSKGEPSQDEASMACEAKEFESEFASHEGESQAREIEHLVLVVHGVGQLVHLRMDRVGFVQDVNAMRKTLKSIYARSPELRVLNNDIESGPGNCRVQVLPVCWRNLLDFPKVRSEKRKPGFNDGDLDENHYPSLEDLSPDASSRVRPLVAELGIEILLYQSGYRDQMTMAVRNEANRIYKLFKERHPGFRGSVHVVGHSLGSAISFDIISEQDAFRKETSTRLPLSVLEPGPGESKERPSLSLDFPVKDFYCLGSPIGLFQMARGRVIAARGSKASAGQSATTRTKFHDQGVAGSDCDGTHSMPAEQSLYTTSFPKISRLFNISYPSDAIAFRLEPLISPQMAAIAPQVIPSVKRSLLETVAPESLTGFGIRVGQSVSGLWSSISSSVVGSFATRSISSEDLGKLWRSVTEQRAAAQQQNAPSAENDTTGSLGRPPSSHSEDAESNPPSDVTAEHRTLYAEFQRHMAEMKKNGTPLPPRERAHKSEQIRREEAKVMALNDTGRVDYSVQEGFLDYHPMTFLMVHMRYWTDEDVSHFILSQILSQRLHEQGDKH